MISQNGSRRHTLSRRINRSFREFISSTKAGTNHPFFSHIAELPATTEAFELDSSDCLTATSGNCVQAEQILSRHHPTSQETIIASSSHHRTMPFHSAGTGISSAFQDRQPSGEQIPGSRTRHRNVHPSMPNQPDISPLRESHASPRVPRLFTVDSLPDNGGSHHARIPAYGTPTSISPASAVSDGCWSAEASGRYVTPWYEMFARRSETVPGYYSADISRGFGWLCYPHVEGLPLTSYRCI